MTTAYTYVANTPAAPTAPPAPAPLAVRLDPDAITRAALTANATALDTYLKTVSPALGDVWNPGAEPPPRQQPATHVEDLGRTKRYRYTLIAVVALSLIAAGGLSFVAYVAGILPNVAITVAIWIGAGASFAILLTARLQHADLTHSPDGVALVHARAAAFADETDAESRRTLTQAYAHAIKIGAETDAHARRQEADARIAAFAANQAERRAALDLEARRALAAATPASRPTETLRFQPLTDWRRPDEPPPPTRVQWGAQGCNTPIAPLETPTEPATQFVAAQPTPPAPGVPLHVATVIRFIAGLYDPRRFDAQGYLANVRVPWGDRGELAKTDRAAVVDLLDRCQPPILTYDPDRRQWRVNLEEPRYRSAGRAVAEIQRAAGL